MRLSSLEAVFAALQQAQVRYLVVGGLAVIAHGYVRLTRDLDLTLDLSPENIRKALAAFTALSYRPGVPVSLEDFADPALRREWQIVRHMVVFPLVSDRHPDVSIDLFVREPFPFAEEYARAAHREIGPGLAVPVVSLATLRAMKETAGRSQDRLDLEKLDRLHPRPDSR